VRFELRRHPHIEARKESGPPRVGGEQVGLNGKIALVLTTAVGTMWCAYVFAALALVAAPQAFGKGTLDSIQWLSQTFIQLVMLSVIMVGQSILSKAADRRAEMTYNDAEATFHEAQQIQAHLAAQDEALDGLLARLRALEAQLLAAAAPDEEPSEA